MGKGFLDELDGFANQGFDQLEGAMKDGSRAASSAPGKFRDAMADRPGEQHAAERRMRSLWMDSDELEAWDSKNKPKSMLD